MSGLLALPSDPDGPQPLRGQVITGLFSTKMDGTQGRELRISYKDRATTEGVLEQQLLERKYTQDISGLIDHGNYLKGAMSNDFQNVMQRALDIARGTGVSVFTTRNGQLGSMFLPGAAFDNQGQRVPFGRQVRQSGLSGVQKAALMFISAARQYARAGQSFNAHDKRPTAIAAQQKLRSLNKESNYIRNVANRFNDISINTKQKAASAAYTELAIQQQAFANNQTPKGRMAFYILGHLMEQAEKRGGVAIQNFVPAKDRTQRVYNLPGQIPSSSANVSLNLANQLQSALQGGNLFVAGGDRMDAEPVLQGAVPRVI